MRAAHAALGAVMLSLTATMVPPGAVAAPVSPSSVAPVSSSATPTDTPSDTLGATPGATLGDTLGQADAAEPAVTPAARKWTPPNGVQFSDPYQADRRVILNTVIRSINNTPKGEVIRIAVWNFDDRAAANALIDAKKRGVKVKVVVAGSVDNPNWTRLARSLNAGKNTGSFARKCQGGCRSKTKIMHSKFYLFSKVNGARNVSMIGSANLTTPAGNRQWNDNIVTKHAKLYSYLVKTFAEYAKDKPVKGSAFDQQKIGRYRVTLFPARNRNPVLRELRQVKCKGVTNGTGNGNGRTKIRIAVAGWFDAYGAQIAEQVRSLWDRGCDVRIVTTLAGRGVNQILKDPRGRGPVPIRKLAPDRNGDGVPEQYLHMKSLAISGVYRKNTGASVVFTGSPNWSARAQRSEEIWLRVLGQKAMTRKYNNHTDRLFSHSASSARMTTRTQLMRSLEGTANARGGTVVPDWLELD
jgi:phosphatidylserine/phosphatidylglycerophosphate/cardiolipin synthase-like enzyme